MRQLIPEKLWLVQSPTANTRTRAPTSSLWFHCLFTLPWSNSCKDHLFHAFSLNWNHLSVRCSGFHHLEQFMLLYFFLLCILCKVKKDKAGLRFWKQFSGTQGKVHRELFIVVLEKKFEIRDESDLYTWAQGIKMLSYSRCINKFKFYVKVNKHKQNVLPKHHFVEEIW